MLGLHIRRYFLAIDTSILLGCLERKVKHRCFLQLFERIAESGHGLCRAPAVVSALDLEPGFPPEGCGLPIGNLTSQWWANLYLSGLDHLLKRELRIPHAQRYMDDITLFADDRRALEDARAACAAWLAAHRRLELKHPDAPVRRTTGTFVYLGYRIRRSGVRVAPERLERAEKRLARLARGGDQERLDRSLASYRGWVRFL